MPTPADITPLILSLHAQLRHWQALPEAIQCALGHIQGEIQSEIEVQQQDPAHEATGQVHARLRPLLASGWDQQPVLADLASWLQNFMPPLHRGGPREVQLAADLHASLEQHLYVACQDYRKELPLLQEWQLRQSETQTESGLFQPGTGDPCLTELTDLVSCLPKPLPVVFPDLPRLAHHRAFRVLVIENEPLWQTFCQDVLGLFQARLGTGIRLEVVVLDTLEKAQAELNKLEKTPFAGQVLALVDLGLPLQTGEPSRREHGLQLISQQLRSYKHNIPVVVLTTPPHLLQDQLDLTAQGVAAMDYILKTCAQDPVLMLLDALERLLRGSLSHTIRIPEGNDPVLIDGIPIPLPPQAREVFLALAQLNQQARAWFSPYDILDQMSLPADNSPDLWQELAETRFGSWGQPYRMMLCNIMRFWAARKQDHPQNLNQALQAFREMNAQLWQNSQILMGLWLEQQQIPRQSGAAQFESVFGNATVRSQRQPQLVYDAVLEIRHRIHAAFNQAGRYVNAGQDILVQNVGDSGYRLKGHLETGSTVTDPPIRRYRVLALENNLARQARYQELFYQLPHLHLTLAGSVESAVLAVRDSHFDVLLLDLHVPLEETQWQANPDQGVHDGGLMALGAIRRQIPDIQVLVPTLWVDRDDLRQRLGVLGVPPTRVIPLADGQAGLWEGHLMLNLMRLCQEIEQEISLPALPAWRCPLVEIIRDQGQQLELRVNGRPSVFRSKQARLMRCLLASVGEAVEEEHLLEMLYPGKKPTQGLTQLLKRIYNEIRTGWIPEGQMLAEDVDPAQVILESVRLPEKGLRLHAYVVKKV